MRRGCRPETAGPPHTTAGGGGRAAAAGPKRPRGGPGAENVSGLACPRPLSGGGAGRRLGGRGARTRRDTRARPGLFIRAGARAVRTFRCAWPPACAFPVRISRFLEPRPVGKSDFQRRARACPRPPGSGRALCCWVAALPRARTEHPFCAEGPRAGDWQCEEGCGLGPSSSGDVPGLLGRNLPALRFGLRPRKGGGASESARSPRRMRRPEARVRVGCLGRVLSCF